ncbi:hypothetical protein [Lacticaseibacillus jixiensis]|uniref:hypothetical protein n=1 Tax=Lacticaseibacillus jixiensis TaxID=3231926 RepID=UPI0036F3EFF2
MSDRTLNDFPQGAFTAFSTATMTYFLPVRPDLDDHTLVTFFGADAKNVRQSATGLTLRLPDAPPVRAKQGQIIARFKNGKYKVIDVDYYHKNFNDPLATLD